MIISLSVIQLFATEIRPKKSERPEKIWKSLLHQRRRSRNVSICGDSCSTKREFRKREITSQNQRAEDASTHSSPAK